MSTFTRILAWILIVISVLGILVCSVAIAGSWMINDSLTREVLKLVSRAQTALTRVEDSLTLADATLQDASSAVATIQEAASKLGDRIEKNSPVLDRISQILKDGSVTDTRSPWASYAMTVVFPRGSVTEVGRP